MARKWPCLCCACRPSRAITEDEDSQNIEHIRDSPGMLGSRMGPHPPLQLYHEVELNKERDLLPVSTANILLFLKLYEPKTENLKVGVH